MLNRFKILMAVLLFAGALTSRVYANPSHNPAAPAMLKGEKYFEIGENVSLFAEGSYYYVDEKEFATEGDQFEFTATPNKIGINYGNMAQLYGVIGAAEAVQSFDIGPAQKIEFKSEWDFLFGVGGSVILLERELDLFPGSVLFIGGGASIYFFDPEVDELNVNGTTFGKGDAGVTSVEYDFKMFQGSLGAGIAIADRIIPYGGIVLSDATGDAKATVNGTVFNVDNLEPANRIGVFVGTDIVFEDNVSINIEGRFIDEIAFSSSVRLKF